MAFMKCRFCGKSAGSQIKTKDWICADCIKTLGGMKHWFEIRNMTPEQIYFALGASDYPSKGAYASQSLTEEVLQAKVRATRTQTQGKYGESKTLGCFGVIMLLIAVMTTTFLAIALFGGDSTKQSPEAATTAAPATHAVGVTQAPVTEKVVYEDSGLKVTFMGVTDVVGSVGLKFELENKSNEEITVYPENASINDHMVMLGSGIPATIRPGKKFDQVWVTNPETAGISNTKDIEQIEFVLRYGPSDSVFSEGKQTKLIHIDV